MTLGLLRLGTDPLGLVFRLRVAFGVDSGVESSSASDGAVEEEFVPVRKFRLVHVYVIDV